MKDFISISDCTAPELRHMLDVAAHLKGQYRATGRNEPILAGKTLAMIFEKPSLRTRVSFSVAMNHLGGSALMLRNEEVGLDVREPAQDVARVLSGMCSGIMARTFEHEKIVKLAKHATVPVINGLTDYSHPCQAMADLMTVEEHFRSLFDDVFLVSGFEYARVTSGAADPIFEPGRLRNRLRELIRAR